MTTITVQCPTCPVCSPPMQSKHVASPPTTTFTKKINPDSNKIIKQIQSGFTTPTFTKKINPDSNHAKRKIHSGSTYDMWEFLGKAFPVNTRQKPGGIVDAWKGVERKLQRESKKRIKSKPMECHLSKGQTVTLNFEFNEKKPGWKYYNKFTASGTGDDACKGTFRLNDHLGLPTVDVSFLSNYRVIGGGNEENRIHCRESGAIPKKLNSSTKNKQTFVCCNYNDTYCEKGMRGYNTGSTWVSSRNNIMFDTFNGNRLCYTTNKGKKIRECSPKAPWVNSGTKLVFKRVD